jgi:hypothetical protein
MKEAYVGNPEYRDLAHFLVHNIRTLKIRSAFEEGGIEYA